MSIQLLQDLTLVEFGMEAAAKRFLPAFWEAWKRLPPNAQQAIDDYLRARPGTIFLCYKMDVKDFPIEPLGCCHWYTHKTYITFLAPFFQHGDKAECLIGVIGHELVHCSRRGNGTWSRDEVEEERETRRLAKEWDFVESPPPGDWVERWRKEHAIDKGHLTQSKQIPDYIQESIKGLLEDARKRFETEKNEVSINVRLKLYEEELKKLTGEELQAMDKGFTPPSK